MSVNVIPMRSRAEKGSFHEIASSSNQLRIPTGAVAINYRQVGAKLRTVSISYARDHVHVACISIFVNV